MAVAVAVAVAVAAAVAVAVLPDSGRVLLAIEGRTAIKYVPVTYTPLASGDRLVEYMYVQTVHKYR